MRIPAYDSGRGRVDGAFGLPPGLKWSLAAQGLTLGGVPMLVFVWPWGCAKPLFGLPQP